MREDGRVRLEARVSPEVRDWLVTEANMRGVTISEVVEAALERSVKYTDFQRRMYASLEGECVVDAFVNRHGLAGAGDLFAGLRAGQ